MNQANTDQLQVNDAGRWITDREYSALTGISRQVLANWRLEDRQRGFIAANRPKWRLFSGAVRYWADSGLLTGQTEIGPELLGTYRPRKAQAGGGRDRG